MSPHPKPQPSEEERLMALVALDAQELAEHSLLTAPDLAKLDGKSMSSEQISQLHAYLDAHPEAFEEVLRRRAAVTQRNASVPRSWLTSLTSWLMPVPRYAIALGASAVCAVVVSLMWIDSPGRLSDGVEDAYAELSEYVPAKTLVDIAGTQSQAEARLGFSGPGQPLDAAAANFAAGFEAGRQRLLESGDAANEAATASETMYVLGQWNALLWTAAQLPEPISTPFWNAQRERFQEFAGEVRQQRRVDPVVIVHVQRVESLLAQLSERNTARPAYELSQELQLFRARFVP